MQQTDEHFASTMRDAGYELTDGSWKKGLYYVRPIDAGGWEACRINGYGDVADLGSSEELADVLAAVEMDRIKRVLARGKLEQWYESIASDAKEQR